MTFLNPFWKSRKYHLDRMSLGELTLAYCQYPAIQVYCALLIACGYLALRWGPGLLPLTMAVLLAVLAYPLAWYLLHRFVLHGRFLYRSPWHAKLWKRIHYDHHRDPRDLRVLFGALYTTLPTIAVITLPIGTLIGGLGAAAAAFAGGLASTLFYEYCHCIQHLSYRPRSRFMRRIKHLHLLHHYYNENGNFGITNFLWDRVTGSYYDNTEERPRSATVFNLGYDEQEIIRYPWVARLTENEQ